MHKDEVGTIRKISALITTKQKKQPANPSWNIKRIKKKVIESVSYLPGSSNTPPSHTWPYCPFSCSLTCGVILQHWVFAKGLELPGDQDFLRIGRSGVVTAQDDGGKQSRSPLRLWNDNLDWQQLWNRPEKRDQTEQQRWKQQQVGRRIWSDWLTVYC